LAVQSLPRHSPGTFGQRPKALQTARLARALQAETGVIGAVVKLQPKPPPGPTPGTPHSPSMPGAPISVRQIQAQEVPAGQQRSPSEQSASLLQRPTVKGKVLLTLPPLSVIRNGPVCAPAGTSVLTF